MNLGCRVSSLCRAALLLEWRNVARHYDGRIAVSALEPGEGWGIVEMWIEQGSSRAEKAGAHRTAYGPRP